MPDSNVGRHHDGNIGRHHDGNIGRHHDGNIGRHHDGDTGRHHDGDTGRHHDGDTAYLQRDRAESFGAVAELYDRFRPSYPAQLIDDLISAVSAAGDGPVLDIGTGTGKAATLLAAAGLDVLGIEVDPKMAEVARAHGLTVEVSPFESWDARGRRFALVTSAQAWHWVDPAAGAPKVAALLNAGGLFAPFWNFHDLDEPTLAAVRRVYAELAPEVAPTYGSRTNRPEERPYVADLERSGAFASIDSHVYRWNDELSVEQWVGRVGTHSDHLRLGPQRLAEVQRALTVALTELGPRVRLVGGTYQIRARVA